MDFVYYINVVRIIYCFCGLNFNYFVKEKFFWFIEEGNFIWFVEEGNVRDRKKFGLVGSFFVNVF